MDRDRWKAANQIFHAALEVPAEERRGYVSAASNGDTRLESQVLNLIKGDEEAGSYLEEPYWLDPIPDLDPPPAPFEPGVMLKNRFRILRHVGQGGMGHVFEALDVDLNVRVAIKVIRPEIADNPAVLNLFRREVRTARTITHPNVCRTYDLDRGHASSSAGGQASSTGSGTREFAFLTMEFLHGETLASRINSSAPLSQAEFLALAKQIAAGLDAAHQAGVIHQDIKPANIMLVPAPDPTAPPRAVITDFGLARRNPLNASAVTSTLHSRALMGTLAYMAPEQLEQDGKVTPATDVYAFGLVLFEMSTGQRAFPSANLLTGIAQRLNAAPPSPKAIAPQLPDLWENVIQSCLRRDPSERLQSASEVAEALAGAPVSLPKTSPPSQPNLPTQTRPIATAKRRWIAAAAVLIAAVSLFFAWMRLHQQQGSSTVTPGALVYLAPINNQTADRNLARVSALLQASLAQSTQINLLDGGKAGDTLQLMTKPPGTKITESIGREIAMRTGAVRVIFPSVKESNGTYTLSIDIQEPDNTPSRYRSRWQNTFSWRASTNNSDSTQMSSAFTSTLRNASDWIRAVVGESANDIARLNTPPEDVTTNSWTALEQYSEALIRHATHDPRGAIESLKKATDIDPSFALAYARAADIDYEIGENESGYQNYRRALDPALSVRLSRRERDRIRGMYMLDSGDFAAGEEAFRDYTSIYESDYTGWSYRCLPLLMLGRTEEAIDVLRHAMQLDPKRSFAPEMLARYLIVEDHLDESKALIPKIHELGDQTFALALQGQLAFLEGRPRDAEHYFRQLQHASDFEDRHQGFGLLARLRAEQGNYTEALQIIAQSLAADRAEGDRVAQASDLVDRAYLALEQHRDAESIEDLHTALELNGGEYVVSNAMDTVEQIAVGDARQNFGPQIEVLLQQLENRIHRDPDSVLDSIHNSRLTGVRYLVQGNPPLSAKAMQPAIQLTAPAETRIPFAIMHEATAKTHLSAEAKRVNLENALNDYQSVADRPGYIWNAAMQYPPGYYFLNSRRFLNVAAKLGISNAVTQKCQEKLKKYAL